MSFVRVLGLRNSVQRLYGAGGGGDPRVQVLSHADVVVATYSLQAGVFPRVQVLSVPASPLQVETQDPRDTSFRSRYVPCANPDWYSEHLDVALHPLFKQICVLGKSAT